jgi:RNA polymerase sigma-70 factor (ECF subfamily)
LKQNRPVRALTVCTGLHMQKRTVDLALLKKAQQGHRESLCALAEAARNDVLLYLRRLTLDMHVAEDLCQETIVQMLKSLPKLDLPSEKSFWAWLYRTAFSRVSRQYRDQGATRVRKRTTVDSRILDQMPARGLSGPQALMNKEFAAAVYEAMDALALRYRNILTLRCFQDFSYAEIAGTTGGTELQARLLFFRAKRSLRHQLATRGFKKKAQLLPALALFAALTAGQSKAAAATTLVEAATLEVSAGTFAIGMATSKIGIAVLVTTAACIIAGTTGVRAFTPQRDPPQAVAEGAENMPVVDTTLLDLLRNPDFTGPSAIGKSNAPRGTGLFWTDRSSDGPARSNADLRKLLLNKSQRDMRAVVITSGHWIDTRFQRPIVDGPGPDIVIAGWADPAPAISVFGAKGPGVPLRNPTQLRDTWGRIILGYDLAQLPQIVPVNDVVITGTHNQGPHQGFELHEIRARTVQDGQALK